MTLRAALLALVMSSAFQVGCGEPAANLPPKNLVLICLDTVRFDSFQLAARHGLGDEWLAKAVTFEGVQSTGPWTVPAVASVLTGTHPMRHGAGTFPGSVGASQFPAAGADTSGGVLSVANLDGTVPAPLQPDIPTMAERLVEHGFDTAAFVAHPWFRARYGLRRGFRDFELIAHRSSLMQRAGVWLSERGEGDGPFFLYLHWMDAHAHFGWDPEDRLRRAAHLPEALRAAAIAAAPGGVCADASASSCSHYLAYVDSVYLQLQSVAELLDDLDDAGLLRESVVMIYSDHGEEFMDHVAEQRALNVDPRGIHGEGHGQSLYQELLHVPVMAWHPRIEGGSLSSAVSLVDLMPTAFEWLGLDAGTSGWDGRSLGSELAAGSSLARARTTAGAKESAEIPLFSTRIAYGPEQVAVVLGGWKRVARADGARLLFQLQADPFERSPIRNEEIEQQLDALLDEYVSAGRATEAGAAPPLSASQLRELQAIGYLKSAPRGSDEAGPAANDSSLQPGSAQAE